ncbi:MAG: BBP7 family outer membrane beta-barrel protein [Thermoguttaceae bacterium]
MHALFPPGIGKLRTILTIGLALWAVAAAGQSNDDNQSQGTSGCDCSGACGSSIFWYGVEPLPRDPWYFSTDAIAMQRLFRGLGPIAVMGLSPTGTLALSQQSLDEPFQAGVRMLVGHTFEDSPNAVEVSYYTLSTWDTSAQASDPTGNLFSPFTNFGANPGISPFSNFGATPDSRVDFNTLVQIRETSRLEDGEVNLKHKLHLPVGDPTVEVMIGVRHVGVREEFDYASSPTQNTNPVSVHAHTNNNLWGPQIGGVVEYGHQDTWLRFEGKAAICENDANRNLDANVNGIDATHPRTFYDGTAEVADISVTLLWHPTDAITWRIGYQALWVDQLALAARNFAPDVTALTDAAAPTPINTRGTLIYHGPFAGLQLSW